MSGINRQQRQLLFEFTRVISGESRKLAIRRNIEAAENGLLGDSLCCPALEGYGRQVRLGVHIKHRTSIW